MEKDFHVRSVTRGNEVPHSESGDPKPETSLKKREEGDQTAKKITVPAVLPIKPIDPDSFLRRRAMKFCEEALEIQRVGDLQKALATYKQSIKILPTAEAHCYLGWALSQLGRFDLAIQECHRAIRLDPTFGNSYNDIGSYLVRKGQWQEGIHWFERAKKIEKYESPHFPYINLGRLYQSKGNTFRALREFKAALKFVPFDSSVRESIRKMEEEMKNTFPLPF